jgi:hypothetical protein
MRMGHTLASFRGGPRKGLRDRVARGDPLNLIRVMPAKGLDTMPNSYVRANVMGPFGSTIDIGNFA